MTRISSKNRGVTLVEVMLTLAISSLLMSTVLVGRNSVRSNAQFTDGMERIKEQVLFTKNQANTSNNQTGNGTSTTKITLGRSLRFSTSTNTTMYIDTILCNTGTDLLCGTTLDITDSSAQTMPWQIQYQGYRIGNGSLTRGDLTLIFGRDDRTGLYQGSWFAGVVAQNSLRSTVFAQQSAITLLFASQDGRQATITVDPAAGTVVRQAL